MAQKTPNTDKNYYSVRETARITGLSECYLRKRISDNSIPNIKTGDKFLLNIARILDLLDAEATEAMTFEQ